MKDLMDFSTEQKVGPIGNFLSHSHQLSSQYKKYRLVCGLLFDHLTSYKSSILQRA